VANLTIKNVPDQLVQRLKVQAGLHRRSLNLEVIACLEAASRAVPIDAKEWLARARALRVTPVRLRLTDRVLNRMKQHGRA